MPIAVFCRVIFVALSLFAVSLQAGELRSSIIKSTVTMSDLPRHEKLPLFDPHRKSFTCVYQDQHVPPVDLQAELWFQQALALDNPDIYYEKRDYPKIYQLYVQAADRGSWKAMLNLASLILSSYPGVPQHDPEIAIEWVEKAMQLGVPDAYDMMGTYHQNGMIKGGDATSAYAFFQRAADMGSPSAMTFLGEQLAGTYDDPEGEFWGNLPIATQMLECAVSQGYGPAAYKLGFIYQRPNTPDAKARALHVLQEGIKLGCAKCADKLSVEFNGMYLTDGTGLVGTIDKARSERYSKIGDMLEHYQGRLKLPNLDKVLPLPPAPLPKWNGDVKALIDTAKPASDSSRLRTTKRSSAAHLH
jgi:TPR repeat protein